MSDSPIPLDTDATKTRRLVPQFSLTKQNLGSDNGRTRSTAETPKKPVIRFTREQLISLRKESQVLSSMLPLTEVVSVESLNPVCFSRLEPEDVSRIYSFASKDGHGRGRARGKITRPDDSDRIIEEPRKTDLWDDDDVVASGENFDLADFAKAALKFRSDMEEFKGGIELDEGFCGEEDAIASLIEPRQEVLPSKVPLAESSLSSLLMEEPTLPQFSSSISSVLDSGNTSFFPLDFTTPFQGIFSANDKLQVVEWYYTDPQNNLQGPFAQETMRLWNHEGYFSSDLPIKLVNWTKFHLFRDVFPNSALAFVDVPAEPLSPFFLPSNEVPSLQIVNEDSLVSVPVASVVEPVVKISPDPMLDVEPPSTQPVVVQHNVEKSDFAKKLLGIGRGKLIDEQKPIEKVVVPQEVKKAAIAVEAKEINAPTPVVIETDVSDQTVSKQTKGWSNASAKPIVRLADIQQQQQEEIKVNPDKSLVSVPAPVQARSMSVQLKSLLGVKDTKTAWSVNSAPDSAASSLKDIMNEEINRKQQVEEAHSDVVSPPGASWAAKARSAPALNAPVVAVGPSVNAKSLGSATITPVVVPVAMVEQKISTTTELKPPVATSNTKSGFGGKLMSKEQSDWCRAQLVKITGSDDAMELMEFCMSLKSSVEVRSYFCEYLGSSPQVTNFATEFIKLKDEKKNVVVEKQQDNKFQSVVNKKKKKQIGK